MIFILTRMIYCSTFIIYKSLYQIDTEFLDCDDFLTGDLRVDTARHITLARPEKLEVLKSAKRWYVDGTFEVVHRTFTQLFSIHAERRLCKASHASVCSHVTQTKERI